MDDEQAMRLAIREAFVAREHGEDPFGAVLLDPDGAVCHAAHSRCVALSDPTAHAEMLIIREYCQRDKRIYLKGYTLVCSAETCSMCSGAIKWAKIQKVVFSVPQSYLQEISGGRPKPSCESILNSGYIQIQIIGNVLFEEGKKIFEQFQFTPKDRP